MSPEGACAGKTTLNLVVDQQRANFRTSCTQRIQEIGRRNVNTAFALDRLNDDAAGFGGHKRVNSSNVVIRPVVEAWDHRGEGFLIFGIGCCGEGAHCAAMEGVVKGDKVVFGAGGVEYAASFAGELYGGFIGFGAGVADEDAGGVVHSAGCTGLLDEELGQRAGPRVVVEIRSVDKRAGLGGVGFLRTCEWKTCLSYLLCHQGHHFWVTVSQ